MAVKRVRSYLVAVFLGALLATPVMAQEPRTCGDEPEPFSYLTLTLAWSQRYCSTANHREQSACRDGRPYGLVLEGLQPRCQNGAPQYCPNSPPLDEAAITTMYDVLPDRRLIRFLWRKHVSCGEYQANQYAAVLRLLSVAVKAPPELTPPLAKTEITVTEIVEAFQRIAPRIQPENLAVHCSGRFLQRIELCLEKGLGLQPCAPDVRHTCPPGKIKLRTSR